MYFKDSGELKALSPLKDGKWDRDILYEYLVWSCNERFAVFTDSYFDRYKNDELLADMLFDFLLCEYYDGSDCQMGAARYIARLDISVLKKKKTLLQRAQENVVLWKRPFGDDEYFRLFVDEKKITLCGDDCNKCPRFLAGNESELLRTAELWHRVGWRDTIVSADEMKCSGCSPQKQCAYSLMECVKSKGIEKCDDCPDFPCEKIRDCFKRSDFYKEKCRKVCTEDEYWSLEEAFFQKEENLKIQRGI